MVSELDITRTTFIRAILAQILQICLTAIYPLLLAWKGRRYVFRSSHQSEHPLFSLCSSLLYHTLQVSLLRGLTAAKPTSTEDRFRERELVAPSQPFGKLETLLRSLEFEQPGRYTML